MKLKYLVIGAASLLVLGIGTLAGGWDGSAGVTAGWPMNQWTVKFCGSAVGWPALIGLSCLVVSLLVLIAALVAVTTRSPTS